ALWTENASLICCRTARFGDGMSGPTSRGGPAHPVLCDRGLEGRAVADDARGRLLSSFRSSVAASLRPPSLGRGKSWVDVVAACHRMPPINADPTLVG